MPQSNEKQDKARTKAASQVTAEKGRGSSASGVSRSTFEAALARVVSVARVVAQDNGETRRTLPSGRSRPGEADVPESAPSVEAVKAGAREQLNTALRELEPEVALKLRTVMIAGRDGQSIGAVNVNLSLSDAEAGFAAMAADSGENGPLLVDYLRRGHALACAAGINLDGPLADWQSHASDDLDERAWLSFGKQLANSQPADWQCLGIVETGSQELNKLYLKLGDHAWWSFQAVLDRPTLAGVEKERRSLAKRRLKGVSTSNLEGLVGKLGVAQGRALRRAGRAICARVGYVNEAAAR